MDGFRGLKTAAFIFQVNHQGGDIRRGDSGDAGRLPQVQGPDRASFSLASSLRPWIEL